MLSYDKLLKDVKTLAIVCNQWGDTGKGKFVDLFAEWADIIVRGTGSDNAGHTIRLGDIQHIFHLIPSGILRDSGGKINIIASGTGVNPRVIMEELGLLNKAGLSYNNLMISLNAKLVLPTHILMDRLKESNSSGKIGTTGRGVGPLYTDHYARLGLVVNDLLNPALFRKKLERNLRDKINIFKQYDSQLISEILQHPQLENGIYYSQENIINLDAITERYLEYGKKLKGMIYDTDAFIREQVGKKKILLEGAQGLMLSIDKGSYPYVTSSDCSAQGLSRGAGLKDNDIDLVLGIVKAFVMTRVGEGPFPTEIDGQESAKWCGQAGINKQVEKEKYPLTTVNSKNEFEQGVAIRMAGAEYGATTGRPRRTGWLDLPLLRYAVSQNGADIIFTKLDILDNCETIKICEHYIFRGENVRYGQETFKNGDIIKTTIPNSEILEKCQPVYKEFPGWLSDISHAQTMAELPKKLTDIIDYISKETGVRPRVLSVGADREATIFA